MLGHEGKVALVTGAAQGIGQTYAHRLAKEGADVIALDLRAPDETLEAIRSEGRRGMSYVGDLRDPATAPSVARAIDAEFGHCDILVNNAGVYPAKTFAETDNAAWEWVRSLNLDAAFYLCRALVPGMRARGWGRVVNQTSNIVNMQVDGCFAYIASKAGLVGLTRALASEVGADGVTVNAIAPSLVETPGTRGRERGPTGMSWEEETAIVADLVQAIKRVSKPDDLAGTLAFLTSDEAAFITGQTIFVDGGTVRVG